MAYQVTTGRFVGRITELARLRELLARATAGQPLVALVGGEAGVGKTRQDAGEDRQHHQRPVQPKGYISVHVHASTLVGSRSGDPAQVGPVDVLAGAGSLNSSLRRPSNPV